MSAPLSPRGKWLAFAHEVLQRRSFDQGCSDETEGLSCPECLCSTVYKIRHDDKPDTVVVHAAETSPPVSRQLSLDSMGSPSATLPARMRSGSDADVHISDEDVHNYLLEAGVHVNHIIVQYPFIYCYVRALDCGSARAMTVRVTFDNWESFEDVPGRLESSDSTSSQYVATIRVPDTTTPCTDLELAACFVVDNVERWDNNNNANYKIRICNTAAY
eukprot:m.49982 g.49982  ORF g.49982 m.49982 type:complete len:217 (-) comp6506_c0_seq1:119-769(-)